jgi:hypothetical protein
MNAVGGLPTNPVLMLVHGVDQLNKLYGIRFYQDARPAVVDEVIALNHNLGILGRRQGWLAFHLLESIDLMKVIIEPKDIEDVQKTAAERFLVNLTSFSKL